MRSSHVNHASVAKIALSYSEEPVSRVYRVSNINIYKNIMKLEYAHLHMSYETIVSDASVVISVRLFECIFVLM